MATKKNHPWFQGAQAQGRFLLEDLRSVTSLSFASVVLLVNPPRTAEAEAQRCAPEVYQTASPPSPGKHREREQTQTGFAGDGA